MLKYHVLAVEPDRSELQLWYKALETFLNVLVISACGQVSCFLFLPCRWTRDKIEIQDRGPSKSDIFANIKS